MNKLLSLSSGESEGSNNKSRVSQACTACKRRKVKCVGNPCAYCIKKGYECEFKSQKKRGPPSKKIRECEAVSLALLNQIQSSMEAAYTQNNFVDFYFNYIGRYIPSDFKSSLFYSSGSDFNNNLTSQLYTLSAHVMQFLGNENLELQCIEKAQRFATSLFECDTLESATSLMMMAGYLGTNNPKFKLYMNMAANIAEQPALKATIEGIKVKHASRAVLAFVDDTLTQKQKYDFFIEHTCNSQDVQTCLSYITPTDMAAMTLIKIKYLLLLNANYDDSKKSIFIQSIKSPAPVMSVENLMELFAEVQKLYDLINSIDCNHPNYHFCLFAAAHIRLLVEWRAGNSQDALATALVAANIFKDNKMLGIWYHHCFYPNLIIPYFLQINGLVEKANELLDIFEQYATSIAIKQEIRTTWKELCISTGIYSMAVIEELDVTEYIPNLSPSLSPLSSTLIAGTFSPNNNTDNNNTTISQPVSSTSTFYNTMPLSTLPQQNILSTSQHNSQLSQPQPQQPQQLQQPQQQLQLQMSNDFVIPSPELLFDDMVDLLFSPNSFGSHGNM